MWNVVALLIFAPLAATAGEIGAVRPCGAGPVLGDPLGASLKCYVAGSMHAVEVGLGANDLGPRAPGAEMWAVYLIHPYDPYRSDHLEVSLHGGGGPVVGRLWKKPAKPQGSSVTPAAAWGGARLQVGADADLESLPIQISLDLGIDLVLRPKVEVDPVFTLCGRYYF